MEDMEKKIDLNMDKVIDIVVDLIDKTYGALGYSGFKIHKIKPNTKEDIYYVYYSFIVRGEEKKTYYKFKVDIDRHKSLELKEIKKEEIFEDDNNK
jgi:hypothetical protein